MALWSEDFDEDLFNAWRAGVESARIAAYNILERKFIGAAIESLKSFLPDKYEVADEARETCEDTFLAVEEVIKKDPCLGPQALRGLFRKYLKEYKIKDKIRQIVRRIGERSFTVSLEQPVSIGKRGEEKGEAVRLGDTIEDKTAKTPEETFIDQEAERERVERVNRFRENLSPTLRGHLDAVIEAVKGENSEVELIEVVSDVVEFLESKGKHYEDMVRSIRRICGKCKDKRQTYDSHNNRLRKAWNEFTMT